MAEKWLSIRVELVSGGGSVLWPRPGRIFAAAPDHTFAQLAEAVDKSFARWDLSHLHEFRLADGTRIAAPDPDGPEDWDGPRPTTLDLAKVSLGRLTPGERFAYQFDLGDSWMHLCTLEPQLVDPLEVLGVITPDPVPYEGWGTIPDQYGRAWEDDDGDTDPPRDTNGADLPPIGPWARRPRRR